MRRVPMEAMPNFVENDPDETVLFGPHVVELDGNDYFVNDSHSLIVGLMSHDSGDVITVTLHRKSATMPISMGLLHTLSVDCARDTANALLELVRQVETAANDQAQAALRKAGGR